MVKLYQDGNGGTMEICMTEACLVLEALRKACCLRFENISTDTEMITSERKQLEAILLRAARDVVVHNTIPSSSGASDDSLSSSSTLLNPSPKLRLLALEWAVTPGLLDSESSLPLTLLVSLADDDSNAVQLRTRLEWEEATDYLATQGLQSQIMKKNENKFLWARLESIIGVISTSTSARSKIGSGSKLVNYNFDKLPFYLKENKENYKEWLD